MKQTGLKSIIHRGFLLLLTAVILLGSPAMAAEESNDVILTAMKDEMDRSMKSLKIEKMDKPYYLGYLIGDYREWSIKGSFGALTESQEDHRRILKVDLRVGDYQSDNTGFVDRSSILFQLVGRYATVVVEDDYNALRRSLWLATDDAYKDALKQLANKQAYLKSQVQTEEIPDFSREKPVRKIAPLMTFHMDRAKGETLVKKLSALFRQFPALYESHVEMHCQLLHKYFVNSEGTVFRQPETIVALVATASTRAEDGVKLKHYIPFYASSLENLPGEEELAAGIKKMAEELTALVTAPEIKDYVGPVLVTRQAAAELFAQVLVPQLSGQRPPLSNMSQIDQMTTSTKLGQRLNRKVLPGEIKIVDDPTRSEFNGVPLMGSYAVDDEGVEARPVTLVEKGVLKTFLMSRQPRKEIPHSNGHGRAGLLGNPSAQIGNLLITTEGGKTQQQLKTELIQQCKDQGLEFGLIIKTFDNPAITGTDADPLSFLTRSASSGNQLTAPVMMVRVFVQDGREELVRGISISNLDVNDLKDIVALGSDSYVMPRMMAPGGSAMGSALFVFSSQGRQGMGIPATIAAPSVLFEELEFKKNEAKQEKLPLLPHPFFGQ